jgi:hypothetical protein
MMLLKLLEIMSNSDAKIVVIYGPKAGIQVWQKEVNHRLGNGRRYFFEQPSAGRQAFS